MNDAINADIKDIGREISRHLMDDIFENNGKIIGLRHILSKFLRVVLYVLKD